MWSILTEYACTSITISDVVLYIIPVIFGASQPLGVVSCSRLHVMLVLCYEFVPWSPCLPSSIDSMPVVLSETALPCCAFFILLFLTTTGWKSNRSSCSGGDREVGEALGFPALPLTLCERGSSLRDLHKFHPCIDGQGPCPSFISSLENRWAFYPQGQIRAST